MPPLYGRRECIAGDPTTYARRVVTLSPTILLQVVSATASMLRWRSGRSEGAATRARRWLLDREQLA